MRRSIGFRGRLVGLLAVVLAALALALAAVLPARMDAHARSWAESRSLGIARLLARSCQASLDFDDGPGAASQLAALAASPGARYAVLRRPDGSELARWGALPERSVEAGAAADGAALDGAVIRARVPVATRAGPSGALLLGFGLEELAERQAEARLTILRLTAVLFVLGALGAFAAGTLLVRPLAGITDVARRVATGDDRAIRDLPRARGDEVGTLAAAFDRMVGRLYEQQARIQEMNADLEARVRERTQELQRTGEALAELKRAQEQLIVADRRVSVGRLAAGAAHEINNPLAYIRANVEVVRADLARARALLDDDAPAARAEARALVAGADEPLDDVRQGVDRVQHIVRALKTFSRGDDDDRQPRRLDAPLLTALDMAAPEIRGRARVEQDLRPVPLVAASEVRLSQVFLNLLINAAQAIPPGAADRNQITVRLFTDARGWAVAEVQDTGCGVAPEIRASIFDPFFTTKPVGLGTGLGLSISQGIVRTLGGELTVESEPGHGATFRFALPPAGAAPAPATATPAAGTAPATTPTAPPRSGPRRRVLVIDDERLVAGSLERTLAAEHDVTLAAGGQEALERVARGEHWDRILCDVMMPGMTGFEFHSRLTAVAPALAGRVTFMTGGACERTRAFLASWPGGFLEKPIDAAALHRAVRA